MDSKWKFCALVLGLILVLCVIPSGTVSVPIKKDIIPQDDDPEVNDRAVALGLFGKFGLEDGMATGRFVSFSIDNDTGNISEFSLRSNVEAIDLFEYLAFEDLELSKNDIKVAGSIMKVGADLVDIKVHDNPTGLIQVKVGRDGVNATMLVVSGLDVEERATDNATVIMIQSPGVLGVVKVRNGSVDIDETSYGTYINMTLADRDRLMIRFQPMVGERNGELEHAVFEGVIDDLVAAEISISTDDGDVGYEDMSYDPDMSVKVKDADEEEIVVEASSQNSKGKVLFISMDREAISGLEEVEVRLDGLKVPGAGSPDDVIDAASSMSEEALCYSVENDGTEQIIVYVPSFSAHEISIVSVSPGKVAYGNMEWGLAIVGAVGVLALAGYMIVRRR